MDSIAQAVSADIYRYQGGLRRLKYWVDIEPELRKPLTSMKDGDIVEQGKHEKLLAKKGFYAELYNSQFEGKEI